MKHAYAPFNFIPVTGGLLAASPTVAANAGGLSDGLLTPLCTFGSAAGSLQVIWDLGSAQAVNCFALLNHNICEATTPHVYLDGADDSAFTVNDVRVLDTVPLNTPADHEDSRFRDHVFQFPATTKRYWLLTVLFSGTFTPSTIGEARRCSRAPCSCPARW